MLLNFMPRFVSSEKQSRAALVYFMFQARNRACSPEYCLVIVTSGTLHYLCAVLKNLQAVFSWMCVLVGLMSLNRKFVTLRHLFPLATFARHW